MSTAPDAPPPPDTGCGLLIAVLWGILVWAIAAGVLIWRIRHA